MSFSYVGMRDTTSRTSTALSLFSARTIGRNDDACITSAADVSLVTAASRTLAADDDSPFIISSRSLATPRIVNVDSGLFALNETSSAHVYVSGKRRVSTSLKVRVSFSLSALAVISATSAT